MKVLLVQPPVKDFYHTTIRSYPLSLLYIASKIPDSFEIKLFNFRKAKPRIIKNDDFKELENFYKTEKISPFTLFKGYKLYGKSNEEIKKSLEAEKPDIIGISSNFSAHFNETIEFLKISKEACPRAITILGGHHPTLFPEEVLKLKEVDYLIRGEGETPFYEFLTGKEKEKIKGLCYKKNGKIIINDINFEENIDFLPKREIIEKKDYKWGGAYFSQFISTRGCPFSCSFCGKLNFPFRKRSLKSLEKEIEILKKEKIEFLSLEDEVLGYDKCHFKELLNLFKGKNFKLSCMNGIYPGVLEKEILNEMIEAGFKKLNLSLVDISKKTLIIEDRKIYLEDEKLKLIENYPFLIEIHFIIGLPGQRIEDIIEIFLYLIEKRNLIAPSVYYLAPFSKDFKKYYKGEDFKYFRSSALKSPNKSFSQRIIYTILIISRFINYLKKAIDLFEIKNLDELLFLTKNDEEKEIIKRLLEEKNFYYFDKNLKEFLREPVEDELVKDFFKKLKGKKIKGYKTYNFLWYN